MAAPQTHTPTGLGNDHAESGSVLSKLEEGAKQNAQEGARQPGSQDGPDGQTQRPWDRAITKEELRESSRNWSLAGDAGLLHYLQDFSQRMFSRTHELDKIVDHLVYDTKGLDCKVQNTFNDFLMLSNTQFIENRVYDEEVSQEEGGPEKEETNKTEKTREQAEAEVLPRFSQAVALGLQVLDDAFITVEITPEEESDDEDEGETSIPSSMVADPIIEPKDAYADRPLPHLIGTAEFFHDETVGLIEEQSDDEDEQAKKKEEEESEESETESESEKSEEEATETETESEVTESSDEEIKTKEKKPAKVKASVSDSESEDEDLFGEKKEVADSGSGDEVVPQSNLQAELAAKLGLPAAMPSKQEEGTKSKIEDEDTQSIVSKSTIGVDGDTVSVASTTTSKHSKKRSKTRTKSVDSHSSKHKGKKHHQKETSVEEDNLFGASDDIATFGEPFAPKSGLFSGGGTLFDDNEEDNLFGDTTSTTESVSTKVEEPTEPVEIKPRARTTSTGKKIPAGAVSIFGDASPLFGKQSSIQEENKSKDETGKQERPASKAVPPPVKGLFDDDEEDDSLFEQPKPKQDALTVDAPIPRKKTLELFDDDEEDDLFNSKLKAETTEKAQESEGKKKVPVGGVSIFGGALPNAVNDKAKQKSTTEAQSSEGGKDKPKGLFDDQDSLFSDEVKTEEKKDVPAKTSSTKSKNVISLFDDDEQDEVEDDLFASLGAPKEKPKDTSREKVIKTPTATDSAPDKTKKIETPSKPVTKKGGLFDDEEDDLFASPAPAEKRQPEKTQPPKPKEKKPTSTKPTSKVSSLFDDEQDDGMFGESQDLFPATAKTETKDPPKPSQSYTVTVEKAQPKEASMFADEGSDEDDLFGTKTTNKPKIKQSDNAVKEKRKADSIIKPVATKEKPPLTVGSEKPSTGKKVKGLFDEDDSEDNFLSKDSPPKEVPAKEAPPKESPPKVASKDIKPTEKKTDNPKRKEPDPLGSLLSDDDNSTNEAPAQATTAPKKPPGAVSLFGGIDPFANKKKRTEETKPSEEEKRTSESRTTPPPVEEPVEATSTSTVESVSETTDGRPVGKSIGQLQKSLNFNPAALLPGSSPPKRKPESTEADFDKPAEVKTLQNAAKDRARVQSKRRPPSRGARRVAAQMSTEELFPSTEEPVADLPSATNSISGITSSDMIFGPPSLTDSGPILDSVDSASDLFAGKPVTSAKPDIAKSKPVKAVDDIFEDDTGDDIFGDMPPMLTTKAKNEEVNVSQSKKPAADTLFETAVTPKPPAVASSVSESISKKVEPALVESDDDDLFSPRKSSKAKTDLAVKDADAKAKKLVNAGKGEEPDASLVASPKKAKKEEPKKTTKKTVKKWDDNDLFGDSGSIFDDLPSKSKEKKKKKSEPAKDIFADTGDIFSSPKTTTEKKSKVTKKKTDKTSKNVKTVFDENAPSIFDDPLNALGGD